jgi:hypothetical protein
MRPQKSVIVMPGADQVRSALRAMQQLPGVEVALVLPMDAPNLAAIPGLDQMLAAAQAAGKDLTLIGGSDTARAEAIALGLRVSTSVAAWEEWRTVAQQAATQLEQHLQARGAESGWRIIHADRAIQAEEDDVPAYLAALRTEGGPILALPPTGDAIPADEQYEDAIVALIWQTGKLNGDISLQGNA